jgi:cell wall-associated NlpC family hydrolase
MIIFTAERKEQARAAFNRWHGTPHHDRIAIIGKGCDCVNLIRVIYHESDIVDGRSLGGYSTTLGTWKESDQLKGAFQSVLHTTEHTTEEPKFGDMIVFKNGGGLSAHCGLYAEGLVWHSLARRCVTASPWKHWKHKAESLLRLTRTGYKADPKSLLRG